MVSLPSGSRVLQVTGEGLENPDGNVRTLMDLQRQTSYAEVTGFLVDMDVRADGHWIAYGTTHRGSGGHEVVNLQTRKRWVGDIDGLHHIRFRPNYPHVIVGGSSFNKTVEVRNLDTGVIIDRWVEPQGEMDRGEGSAAYGWTELMNSLALTADGNRLFLVKSDGSIRCSRSVLRENWQAGWSYFQPAKWIGVP